MLRRDHDSSRALPVAWATAIARGRGVARRLFTRSDADLEDVAASAARHALSDLARSGVGWADQ
jgi:hypothetical protein